MQFLPQIFVLTKHAWALQEDINVLYRINDPKSKDTATTKQINEIIGKLTSEITETHQAIAKLKEETP